MSKENNTTKNNAPTEQGRDKANLILITEKNIEKIKASAKMLNEVIESLQI